MSNASDALEKLRHRQVGGEACLEPSAPLQIVIETNEADNTISIADSGVGMDRQELIDNLGTIARSGSRAFMQRLREGGGGGGAGAGAGGGSDTGANIIGQFGVGFYSSFMVAEHVTVLSRSAVPGSRAQRWTSAGDGAYEIAEVPESAPAAETVARGSRIVLKLRDSCRDFSRAASVKEVRANEQASCAPCALAARALARCRCGAGQRARPRERARARARSRAPGAPSRILSAF